MSKNRVIAGDYAEAKIMFDYGAKMLAVNGNGNYFLLNYDSIESYEIINEEYRKSATSAISRAAVGAAILGPVGLVAGVTAKEKGIHTVAITFRDGKQSLVQLDDSFYKKLISTFFAKEESPSADNWELVGFDDNGVTLKCAICCQSWIFGRAYFQVKRNSRVLPLVSGMQCPDCNNVISKNYAIDIPSSA